MFKNGLCVLSIGLMIFIYSVNANTGSYNWLNLITSVSIIFLGGILTWKGYTRDKAKKNTADGGKK